MTNCYETLKGKNLKGYSPDTYYFLLNSQGSEEECETMFLYLEATYG